MSSFIVLLLTDLKETLNVVRWLQRVPGQEEVWRHLQIDQSEFIWHDFRGQTVWVKHSKCVSGMPNWFRTVCYTCVVVPKLMIELAILYYGSGFVASSFDDQSVILNCLALVFVTQIDEGLYAFGASYNVRYILERNL